jgi:hypothetical protein
MLDKLSLGTDVDKILARLDRSSPEALLNSIAQELLRLHQAFDVLVARMHALEITQTTYDQMVTSSETIAFAPVPRTALIDASFSLSTESGFYPLEYDNLGVPYRWTGPEPTFLFEVFIDRQQPATIRMHYSKGRFDEARQSVRCYVDGHEIATALVEVDGEFEVRGVMPPRDLVGGTIISFVCPGVSVPSADGRSEDIRALGLVFRWLRIDAVPNVSSEHQENRNPPVELPVESNRTTPAKLRRRK